MARRPAPPRIAWALVALGGCSAAATQKLSAPVLLREAKTAADAASAVHFQLSGQNVARDGVNLTEGTGDMARPDSIRGTFGLAIHGFTTNVAVASVGGVFEAELPFSGHYAKADPTTLGLSDPGQLLDPDKGLTKLLVQAENPRMGPRRRVQGELLDTVIFEVPGSDVPVLPVVDPTRAVTITAAIADTNHQLRTVTLVGRFTSATSDTTYTVTLSRYDEHVSISLPPAS